MGHTLQSFLVLRDVFLDVVNVARLYRLFLDFLDLGIAPLATFIFGVILLAQYLNLRGNRVVAYIALIEKACAAGLEIMEDKMVAVLNGQDGKASRFAL